VGLADVDEGKRQLAEQHGIEFRGDFHELLPLVDALAVATPASAHFEIAADCLNAGKHLLVEKPLALNLSHAQKLVELAEQRNLVLAVGHLYRMNPAVIRLKDELESMGQIRYANLRYINLNPQPPVDCSIVFDYGSHLIDLLLFLLAKAPEKVYCNMPHRPSLEREDYAQVLLDWGDFSASLELSWLHPQKKRDAWFIASKSSIYTDLLEQKMKKYAGETELDIPLDWREPLKEELKHFIECVEGGRKPINSGEEACQVVRLCELALESSKTGREVKV
jgi:UDP-N-acetylglucosamine 3-dehydrogenase